MLFNLPNELINIILSYVERPKHTKIMKYLIEECYEEDYDPYFAEYYCDNFCFEYSFYEWYYLYRWNYKLGGKISHKKNICKYKHTPNVLVIGRDRIFKIQ